MISLAAIGAAFKRIPGWVYVLLIAVTALFFFGRYMKEQGREEVLAEWAERKAKDAKEIERLKSEAGKVTVRVETKYVDRVKTIREKGETIVKVREVFVPADSGVLPGAFRLYYNASIEGAVPDPTRIPYTPPVAIADVADTHAVNAERCRIAYATVEGWQEWANDQKRLNP